MPDEERDPSIARIGEELKAQRAAWIERLQDEYRDVKGKCERLHAFIQSAAYDGVHEHEKGLLTSQLGYMQQYLSILKQRVDHHSGE